MRSYAKRAHPLLLFILILSVAASALPVSPAARAKGFAPLAAIQAAPDSDSVSTFDTDCTTSKSSWPLSTSGQASEVCATVTAPVDASRVLRRAQLVNAAGLVVDSVDVTTSSQTITFTLPSVATFDFFGVTLDNRGTWRVNLIDTSDASVRAYATFTVHDADTTKKVADLQVTKSTLGGAEATAGSTLQSQVWLYNAGPDAATNVSFTDVPPANTSFQGIDKSGAPGFNCTTPAVGGSGQTVCTGASLANGATAAFVITYQVNGAVTDGAALDSSASVSSDAIDSYGDTNDSTAEASASNPNPPSCTIGCPANITTTSTAGQNGAVVNFADPTLGGTCGTVTTTPASGSFFAIGTTAVTSTTSEGQSCTFFVTVNAEQDTQNPSISCPADIVVDESSPSANSASVSYTVAATDNSGAPVVTCDSPSGDTFSVGTTEVRCTATDASGNSASCTFNVTVNQVGCDIDANSTAPVPNVASLPTITRACNVTLLPTDDPTANDACGTPISAETTSDRAYDVPGTYTVVWTYTDSAGNTTTQNQTITILPDNSAPVPDAASLPTVTGECSAAITGEAPTATDNCGGSGMVGVALDPLSYNTVGTHVVRWQFTDAAGNSTIQNQTVIVTDTHAPVVALNGPSSVTVECHTSYADAGATATDNCSTPPAPTSTSNVDVNTPGTYQVVWSTTDAGGNTGSATRTVTVVDTTKPVITLNGPNPMTVILGTAFNDPGATATDSCASGVPVTASGVVNTNVIGTYVVTYNATDPSGNAALPVTRTVNVIFNFTGFFSPVDNLPVVNQVKGGQNVPLKFSLNGNQGLGILAAGSPASQQVNCATNAPINDLAETDTPGNSTLTYDAASDRYQYNWKTEKSWTGQCRLLVVTLIDGTSHTANFKFK